MLKLLRGTRGLGDALRHSIRGLAIALIAFTPPAAQALSLLVSPVEVPGGVEIVIGLDTQQDVSG